MASGLDRQQQEDGGLIGQSDTSQDVTQLQGTPHRHRIPRCILSCSLHHNPLLHPASQATSHVASCIASCSASYIASCIPHRSPIASCIPRQSHITSCISHQSHVASCIPHRSHVASRIPRSSQGSGSQCKRYLWKFPILSTMPGYLAEGEQTPRGKPGITQGMSRGWFWDCSSMELYLQSQGREYPPAPAELMLLFSSGERPT